MKLIKVDLCFGRGSERRISELRLAIFFRTSKLYFEFITTTKIKISTTYGILPMVTKACGGLG